MVRGTGTGYGVWDTWYGVQGTEYVVRDTGYVARGTGYGVQGSGVAGTGYGVPGRGTWVPTEKTKSACGRLLTYIWCWSYESVELSKKEIFVSCLGWSTYRVHTKYRYK